ncbi:AsnC family protein [Streptomyces sp. NPDC053560]|uniref:AsnC family protein n=1 Tax=Streptomyces sp. NPDC053560 TaxID=3365711 RepID=UPI0037D695D3
MGQRLQLGVGHRQPRHHPVQPVEVDLVLVVGIRHDPSALLLPRPPHANPCTPQCKTGHQEEVRRRILAWSSILMREDATPLSEDDLALIHALQLRPRASWTELGRALGVDPVTVARRLNRHGQRGMAWGGLSPGPRMFTSCGSAVTSPAPSAAGPSPSPSGPRSRPRPARGRPCADSPAGNP